MKLVTRSSVFAAAALLTCGPITAAYATVEPLTPTPTPSPSTVTDGPSEEATSTEMRCVEEIDDDSVTFEFKPPAALEDLTVTSHGNPVEFDPVGDTSIVVERTETDLPLLIEVWDTENQDRAWCEVELPQLAEPQEPSEPNPGEPSAPSDEAEDPTEDPEEPTDESTDDTGDTTVEPDPPTSTPTPEPEPTPEPPTPTPEPDPTSDPSTDASPAPSEETPESSQPPVTPPPSAPYSPPEGASTPAETPPSSAPPSNTSDTGDPGSVDPQAPRQIRPLAESPRYLLPELLGIESHRGSPLVMPQPRDANDQATTLETLPPISEDELNAIKAELSSPGRADKAPTRAHLDSTVPTERVSNQNSWWLLAGVTSLIGFSSVAWWTLNRRKRRH